MKKFSKIFALSLFGLSLLLGVCSNVMASIIYSLDDGIGEMALTSVSGLNTWANQFTVASGANVIDNIQIPIGWSNDLNGLPITVKLWDDPNNDGNPSDAILLTSAVYTIENADTGIFNIYDIVDTVVSGSFFVGATVVYDVASLGLQFPVLIDLTFSDAGKYSWHGLTDITDEHTYNMSDFPGGGVFMVRAGAYSVPEPNILALIGFGLIGLGFKRKNKAT